MSTNVVIDAADIADPGAAKPVAKKPGKLLIAGAAALVLLAGAGGGAYMFLGSGSAAHGEDAAPAEDAHGASAGSDAAPSTFIDVPQMVVNLRSTDGKTRFLKLHFVLVPGDPGKAEVLKSKLPLYLDALQPFLRELRPEDLNGSAAVFRMKEEMLSRAKDSLGANAVRDVLIQDLIQQ